MSATKITPFLWFNGNLEEAVTFYLSIFKNAKVSHMSRSDDGKTATSASFELDGQQFMALNGGPAFTFSPAISFFVNCATQDEVDDLWERLSEGGEKQRCGWLKDKFGISWQIIPDVLKQLLQDDDDAKSERVWEAMMTMEKIDIDALRRAYEG